MAGKSSAKAQAWPLFDALVERAALREVNPWVTDGAATSYAPDFDTLTKLLAVPLTLDAASQSGVPALAIDVWVAYELRRAGLDPDAVWPRAESPRVVDRDVLKFIRSLPAKEQQPLLDRLPKGGGVASASANILGKNYLKQVDVLMTSWQTGPELLISTKRMDSSFGKNAANRVEESYGDAKNLALRHPLAALGFMFGIRSTAYTSERAQFDWLADLLIKLGREEDAYDACSLLVPEYDAAAPVDDPGPDEMILDPDDVEIEGGDVEVNDEAALFDLAEFGAVSEPAARELPALPRVTLRHDLVPDELAPARFFEVMLRVVLDNSTVAHHKCARELRANPRVVSGS
ncbi:hypothetical protein GOEFS_044_00330 [Gordonia effusa NBRC 100432]|uniref:Uncharacterized protein n=1 Tax=Gordonia effusa NBRC 100432 TaxID=1077974 RepID=H0QYU6_9ACTN|nr:hypothetical protein [Gordonia effusa]GAB17997.1 hypothetical protein GOEFS_044_00330 [Gordonia effusa NBRC 100432]